jgi:hypothetical protein
VGKAIVKQLYTIENFFWPFVTQNGDILLAPPKLSCVPCKILKLSMSRKLTSEQILLLK